MSAVWRQVIRPHTQRIYDCAKRLGIMIDQHSCGKVDEVRTYGRARYARK